MEKFLCDICGKIEEVGIDNIEAFRINGKLYCDDCFYDEFCEGEEDDE